MCWVILSREAPYNPSKELRDYGVNVSASIDFNVSPVVGSYGGRKMEEVDLSEYVQAKSAAKATKSVLEEIAKQMGQDPQLEITLREEDGAYVLYWDGGPHNWALDVGGSTTSLVGSRFENGLGGSELYIEPKTSCALVFGNY